MKMRRVNTLLVVSPERVRATGKSSLINPQAPGFSYLACMTGVHTARVPRDFVVAHGGLRVVRAYMRLDNAQRSGMTTFLRGTTNNNPRVSTCARLEISIWQNNARRAMGLPPSVESVGSP